MVRLTKMQGQVDLEDVFFHSLRLPPGLVVLLVVEVSQEVGRELARLAEVA